MAESFVSDIPDRMVLISLIGEQPIPNLLPIRYLLPAEVLLVETKRTHPHAERLSKLMPTSCTCAMLRVDPYDLAKVLDEVHEEIQLRRWRPEQLTYNLTGGTKTMAYAAYELARRMAVPFVYIESEGAASVLNRFSWGTDGPMLQSREVLPALLTIHDHVRAFAEQVSEKKQKKDDKGEIFERVVRAAIEPVVDEIQQGICLGSSTEIDLMLRCGNNIGAVQVKTGNDAEHIESLAQMATTSTPIGLGTYVRRILVTSRDWSGLTNLKSLAEALRITVVDLPSFDEQHPKGGISDGDNAKLCEAVTRVMGGKTS